MSNIKQEFITRASHVFVLVIILAIAVVARLAYVQFVQVHRGKVWRERIEEVSFQKQTIPAMRGNIYARDGSLLATSLPYYVVAIDPTQAKKKYFDANIDELSRDLSGLFRDKSAQDYRQLITDARVNRRRYLLLNRRHITFEEQQRMLKWPFFRSTAKVAARGGDLRPYYKRYHPFGRMAERTIGNLSAKTGLGQMGLEASFQSELAGKDAVGLVELLAGGVGKPVNDGPEMTPEPGQSLYTTIDVNFQDMAESALHAALTKYHAAKGCVIVMEVATGEIRAIANLTQRIKGGEETYTEDFNYALAGRTDPGSTFKLASFMALLDKKAISLNQPVATGGGQVNYRGLTITDAKRGGYGVITARQVFEKSSNVGTHLLMRSYYYDRPPVFIDYLSRFHLMQPTRIHMKGEAIPNVHTPNHKGWSKWSMPSMSYGYEMQITPLQMLAFYNAVANNGYWVRPMIVRQVKRDNEVVEEIKPYTDPQRICQESTIKQAQGLLRGVVEHGTAKHINNPYYAIAGKTGTAQKIINGDYQAGKYYTSFIGYFPANHPKYTMITVVDTPHGDNVDLLMAGSVAAPVFKEVADRIVAYDVSMHAPIQGGAQKPTSTTAMLAGYADDMHTIGSVVKTATIPSSEGWVEATSSGRWSARTTRSDRVPNVRGLALRDALFLLENRGFRVSVEGHGKVQAQSVAPGTSIDKGTLRTIALQLG